MKVNDFNKIVEEFLEKTKGTLIKKQEEYNLEADRFGFFKRAAAMAGNTPEQALYGFLLKHLVSLSDMVGSGKKFPKELYEEKLGDICNYLILLRGLLEDDNMFEEKK